MQRRDGLRENRDVKETAMSAAYLHSAISIGKASVSLAFPVARQLAAPEQAAADVRGTKRRKLSLVGGPPIPFDWCLSISST